MLFTLYYLNGYYSLSQCIEIDSIRRAIDNIPDIKVKKLALFLLLHAVSEATCAVGKQFAQPIRLFSVDGKVKNFYSFATKYCSHHFPNGYPIYDRYVEKVLIYFKKKDKFSKFTSKNLRNYPKFKTVVEEFKSFYGLDQFNLKDIDKYIWQLGKEYFPIKY